MQTRVGSVPHFAGDKAAPQITRVSESMAENEGKKTGVEEEGLFVFTFPDASKSSSVPDAIKSILGSKGQGAWEVD